MAFSHPPTSYIYTHTLSIFRWWWHSDTRAAINHLQLLSILIALIQLNKFTLWDECDEGDFYTNPKVLQELMSKS